jgi:uncharacterized RDD family membrane protein YckC
MIYSEKHHFLTVWATIPHAVKYYERCDRIMRINFFTTLQRIVAVFFDIFLEGMLLAALIGTKSEIIIVFGIWLTSLAFPFRDLIFGGRSLGKRVMRLHIINIDLKYDAMKVHKGKLAVRNLLCYALYPIEFFVLLFSGKTISDRVTNIAVVSENLLDDNIMLVEEKKKLKEREESIAKGHGGNANVYHNIYSVSKPTDHEQSVRSVSESSDKSLEAESSDAKGKEPKNTNIYAVSDHRPQYDQRYAPKGLGIVGKVIIGVVVVGLLAGGIVIANILNEENKLGYREAYEYLTLSYTYQELGATEDDIKFITHESRNTPYLPDPKERITEEYHFTVKEQYLKIICHEYEGEVYVCKSCTQFK